MNLSCVILMMTENERAKKRVCVNEKSKLAKAKARERSGSERNLFFFLEENMEGILVRELKFKIF